MKNDENAANSPGEQTPRVCLTYDVEIEGRIESRELPFVIGVLSDLSGCPENPPLPLAERKFVRVDNGNFDQVMASFSPRLDLRIADHFKIGEPMLHLLLRFFALSDFDPAAVAAQIPGLQEKLQSGSMGSGAQLDAEPACAFLRGCRRRGD